MQIKMESGRFSISCSISSHPVKQPMFLSANFRPTSYVRDLYDRSLKMSAVSLVCAVPLDKWVLPVTPSCNPWQRQAGKLLETPGPHLSSLTRAVCSTLAKPWLKMWWAADGQLWHRNLWQTELSHRACPQQEKSLSFLFCSSLSCHVQNWI